MLCNSNPSSTSEVMVQTLWVAGDENLVKFVMAFENMKSSTRILSTTT